MASSSGESGEPKGTISEYEKKRLSRIAENNARLEALGIFKSAKALSSPPPNSRKRRATNPEEDDDYRPLDDDDDDDDDDEDEDEDEEFLGKRKNNKASPSPSKTKRSVLLSNKNLNPTGDDDTDDDFDKAIALSLQNSVPTNEDSSSASTWKTNKKHQPAEFMSKMQMTDDELVVYFCQFDEAGKGFITLRDVANMATVHDFTWTDEELQAMIRCFDMDKDGKLSLDDFRKIATRCRMLKKDSS
ncbi:PREDICTED: nucleolar transcription factor 1-like [Camelina sativa]|uniref:Nucleolar transcription factor 1-like n=1 Tax=Camelina sativa TaxID=90675 RepID=A0ABM0THR4_CAMSA|nr:PREDICTED: nucleolar transcription factor 1-like [Camelina sativa]XP_010426604.1 PREDICTED: nucleolar transcription factor 1-like [Camelina sativa]XP_010426614.1 PREDICTED: nucleolar transcription factor 1-like [Camelina sativa]